MTGHYLTEFLGLMAVFSVIIVAPGADFALVIRQCVVHGRRTALITSLGIGLSLLFHISYTILGIGLIVALPLWGILALVWIVCTLVAAFKAYDGQPYRYPVTIRLFK